MLVTMGSPMLEVPEICCREGCSTLARWQIGVRGWALGYPKGSHDPLQIGIGLSVCEAHGAVITLADVMDDKTHERINQVLRILGRVPIDFTTAELELRDMLQPTPGAPRTLN